MPKKRVLLKVRRFLQKPNECALAAAASLANFFKPEIEYKHVRDAFEGNASSGLYTYQQARVLNKLGFNNVKVVSCDLDYLDYSWNKLKKSKLVPRIKKMRTHHRRINDLSGFELADNLLKWISDEQYDNELIVDSNFAKYIRRHLRKSRPLCACISWNSLFKVPKSVGFGQNGDIRGEAEDHAIVVRGFDDKGVFIVDSHHTYYNGPRKKYSSGYYKLSWEIFLQNIPFGDLTLI